MRTEREYSIPLNEITAISVVPPPISTTMLPLGSVMGSPAPIAATIACSTDRKSTRLNSSHLGISYAVFCLKKKKNDTHADRARPRQRSASTHDMRSRHY